MRTNKNSRRVAAIAAALGIAILGSACGKRGDGAGGIGGIGGQLPGGVGGCIPINQPLTFAGIGNSYSWVNIRAGAIPPNAYSQVAGQVFGQLTVGTGNAMGGPYQRQGVDGSIALDVTPSNGYPGGIYPQPGVQYPGYGVPGNYPYGGMPGAPIGYQQPQGYNPMFGQTQQLANVTGVIQISPQVQQDIYYRVGGQLGLSPGVGYPPGYTPYPNGSYLPFPGGLQPGYGQQPGFAQNQYGQQLCVSGIGLDLGHYYNVIYNGRVYLYLNGTQHGYILYFNS